MRYIGNKTKMLSNIKKIIADNEIKGESFADLFSGTGSVAKFFKNNFKIISNDFLYFSYVIQRGFIVNNNKPEFFSLEKVIGKNVFDYLNNIENEVFYKEEYLFLLNNYSNKSGRIYFSDKNAKRIDYWRITLDVWFESNLITEDEYFYLLAIIIEKVPSVSNTSGTYGAYLKKWDNRALKLITILPTEITNNSKLNIAYNQDANILINQIKGSILYLDPPYNSRQYLSNYHILETIAKYDYPEIKGLTGTRVDNKISKYSRSKEAANTLEDLISKANFKYILLSYSSEGLVSEKTVKSIMEKYSKNGKCKVYYFPFSRYESRIKKESKKELNEMVFLIEK